MMLAEGTPARLTARAVSDRHISGTRMQEDTSMDRQFSRRVWSALFCLLVMAPVVWSLGLTEDISPGSPTRYPELPGQWRGSLPTEQGMLVSSPVLVGQLGTSQTSPPASTSPSAPSGSPSPSAPSGSTSQPAPPGSPSQPAPSGSTAQPAPPGGSAPAPLGNTPQPPPLGSAPQPAPSGSTPQPAPLGSTPQPAPSGSTAQPAPPRSGQ
jgi:hypothetical protein